MDSKRYFAGLLEHNQTRTSAKKKIREPVGKEMITTAFLSANHFSPLPRFIPFDTPPRAAGYLRWSHRSITTTHFSSPKNGNNTPPETGCPVPSEQQPINEYQSLSNSFPFSWASSDAVEYNSRLFATGAFFSIFVGLPVSWVGYHGPGFELINLILGSVCSGLFVVILAVLRMYLGWAYVGNRLLSATVEYEETGWYDGQIWVKSAEVLARDRLLGSFTVKPVLGRLKNTLVILGTSLLLCILLLVTNNESSQKITSSVERNGSRAIPGVYKEESARNFEPAAFCGDSDSP